MQQGGFSLLSLVWEAIKNLNLSSEDVNKVSFSFIDAVVSLERLAILANTEGELFNLLQVANGGKISFQFLVEHLCRIVGMTKPQQMPTSGSPIFGNFGPTTVELQMISLAIGITVDQLDALESILVRRSLFSVHRGFVFPKKPL